MMYYCVKLCLRFVVILIVVRLYTVLYCTMNTVRILHHIVEYIVLTRISPGQVQVPHKQPAAGITRPHMQMLAIIFYP